MQRWMNPVTRVATSVLAVLLMAAVGVAVSIGATPVSSASAGVDDFTFDSMNVTYELSRGTSGESQLLVTETLVAVFPETDQNHGVLRALPLHYQGLRLNPQILNVTDEAGNPLEYTTGYTEDFLMVTIAANAFVHGTKTFVISYTEQNIILQPSVGGSPQEFYWDVNGTGWAQPFGQVNASVVVPSALASRLTGKTACYQGSESSDTPCGEKSQQTNAAGDTVLTFGATGLMPYENLTLSVGFEAATFVMPTTSLFSDAAGWFFLLSALAFYAAAVSSIVLRVTRWRNHRGRGIIMAEYAADPDMTPLIAANIMKQPRRAVAAALVDLAVRGLIMISPGAESSGRRREFLLESHKTSSLAAADANLVHAFFGQGITATEPVSTTTPDSARGSRLMALRRAISREMLTNGLRETQGAFLRRVLGAVILIGFIAMWWTGIAVSDAGLGGDLPSWALGLSWLFVIAGLVVVRRVAPLTAKGALERDKLLGLREYIRLAEADRLRVLQSPEGAVRVPVKADSAKQMVKLTERVLPYAILFGLEREWAEVLAKTYDHAETSPTWYGGNDAFAALVFSQSVVSLSSSVATSWASSNSGSSFGGSGGGGFSGGGGGGGGGGGV